MTESTQTRLKTEIAHVLFMDLAGFSLLSIEDQSRTESKLRAIVQGSAAFQGAVASESVIVLDTGDGMALAFFGDPLQAAQCSSEVREQTLAEPTLRLRMGIHTGPVARTTDITGRPNVKGAGVNLAQRVMDCAQPGRILLSETYAEFLSAYEEWVDRVERLGDVAVKHDIQLRLSELHASAVPKRAKEPPRSLESQPRPATKPCRVVLVYKRDAMPDTELLALLERRLAEEGHTVFVDRHLKVGVEWALAIEKEIRAADAVVALVSQASSSSEMMEYEVQTAFDELQRAGRPKILPVRVAYDKPVAGTMGTILDRFQYVLWSEPADGRRVFDELTRALADHGPQEPIAPLETPGGAMSPRSPYYIERPTDARFHEAIGRRDSIVLVKGARQMGKTSLLARGAQNARDAGLKVVLTDFQTLNEAQLENPESLYKSLMILLAHQLRLKVNPGDAWSDWLGPNMNFEQFVVGEILEGAQQPVVWALDEVDRLFTKSYASEVFGLFRSWHNRRQLEPDGPWSNLSLAIAYATEAHLFITDLHQSPFNVGTRLELSDFSREQVGELNERYGAPLKDDNQLDRFYALFNGQPYLVRRGLDELVRENRGLDTLETNAPKDEGPFGDHLRRLLISIMNAQGLEEPVRSLLRGQMVSAEDFFRLRTAGIANGDSPDTAKIRCAIYAAYLGKHLVAA